LRLRERILGWLPFRPRREVSPAGFSREPVDHVVILDGTMSTLQPGCETNAGMLYKLLCEMAPLKRLSLRYEAGIQWHTWRSSRDVIEGRGINRQIRRVYGFIASRYRPGDRIFLFGYSRGAYSVRSLAGVIDQIGLLKAEHATVSNIRQVYRHYQCSPDSDTMKVFSQRYCHARTPVELVGVWDTVKALGLHLPLLWRRNLKRYRFHNHELGPSVAHGYHALARDETRDAFAPVLWTTHDDWHGVVEQVWFRGCHGDIGGQLDGDAAARPLANIPFVWMLERAEGCGLPLPGGWVHRFPRDPMAPSVGTLRGWGKLFLARHKRVIGRDPSESVHPTALAITDELPAESSAAE